HAGWRCNKRRPPPAMGRWAGAVGHGSTRAGVGSDLYPRDGKKTGTGRTHRFRPALVAIASARTRLEAVDHTGGSPASGWRRRRRLFNAWRDTPSRPAATP